MKKYILLFLTISISSLIYAGQAANFGKITPVFNDGKTKEVGISFFEGTWSEALSTATKEKKLIFLDAYAAWCGPCKMMASNTFTDEKVGIYFNKTFINFKMDMEKSTDGPRLSRKFNLKAYPTYYFVDGNESIVHEALGYMDATKFLVVGEEAAAKQK